MDKKGVRSEQEMRITLRRLALEFGVDITPAQGLAGLELEAWLGQAEDRLFEQLYKELRSQGNIMEWKVIASKEGTTQKVYAGWEKEVFRGQPPRVDGWSIVLVVESQSSKLVTGHMTFPERAQFEFAGSLEQMLKAIREAEGGRALFAESQFEFSRM